MAVTHSGPLLAAASGSPKQKGRLWSPVAANKLGAPDPRWRIEGEHLTLRLDRLKVADLLARAPREQPGQVSESELVIELPWPNGNFKSFLIQEASITEPGLKIRCPDLKVFRGRGTSDRSLLTQFEWGPSGFRATISSSDEMVFIGPYAQGDTEHYVLYYARDRHYVLSESAHVPAAERAPPVSPLAVPASPVRPSAAPIEEIEIERRCVGCDNQYKLTFRRDGKATLMIVGATVENTNHTCTGRVRPDAFAELAAVISRQGFWGLNDVYDDPGLRDGGQVATSAVVDGRRKQVSNRNWAGPANLKMIENAIDALGEKISWTELPPPAATR
jgi:hypothetical protein